MKQSEIIKLLSRHRKVNTLVKAACGDFLGKGTYRDVYALKQDDRWVVKIERDMATATFANVTEWRNWINNAEYKIFSKYLSPCLAIDQTGQVLIQRRAKREIDGAKIIYPDYLPNYLTDIHKANFGMIGKQFVCIDYAFLITPAFRMKKVKYWG